MIKVGLIIGIIIGQLLVQPMGERVEWSDEVQQVAEDALCRDAGMVVAENGECVTAETLFSERYGVSFDPDGVLRVDCDLVARCDDEGA